MALIGLKSGVSTGEPNPGVTTWGWYCTHWKLNPERKALKTVALTTREKEMLKNYGKLLGGGAVRRVFRHKLRYRGLR